MGDNPLKGAPRVVACAFSRLTAGAGIALGSFLFMPSRAAVMQTDGLTQACEPKAGVPLSGFAWLAHGCSGRAWFGLSNVAARVAYASVLQSFQVRQVVAIRADDEKSKLYRAFLLPIASKTSAAVTAAHT